MTNLLEVVRSRGKTMQTMGATHDGQFYLYPEEALFMAEVPEQSYPNRFVLLLVF